MDKKQKRRVYLRFLRHEAQERMVDLALLAWPIFVVTGLLTGFLRFWWWVFGL